MHVRRSLARLVATAAIGAVVAVTAVATPAQAVPAGDFTLTMSASDLGLDPSTLRTVVNEVNTEDARDGLTLNQSVKRQVQEFGGDTSGWVDADLRASMSADGTQLTLTVPGAEVQTTANWWQSMLATALSAAAGYSLRGLCITGLGLSGVGAALIPLICTPFGGAITGMTQALIVHGFDGDIGTPTFWIDLAIKTTAGAIGGFLWEKYMSPFFKNGLTAAVRNFGNWLRSKVPGISSWFGTSAGNTVETVAEEWIEMEPLLGQRVTAFDANPPAPSAQPCDSYDTDGANCVGSYSTARALYGSYGGPLYQVQRGDGQKKDIGLLTIGGYVDASQQDSFCGDQSCLISKIYDQSPQFNDLTLAPDGGAAGGNRLADAKALPITVNGHHAYGVFIDGKMGYRNNDAVATAGAGQPEGMYMVASGTHVNSGCCFDFGNAERNSRDTGNGHMDAVNLGTECYFPPCSGSGPWVEADLENGLFSGDNGSNLANKGNGTNYVTAMLKNNGQTTYALKGGDAQNGGLSTWWDGGLPTRGGYRPMQQEGGIILGIGGDNSNWSVGSFFEGAITYGYPSDAAENKVQSNVVSAAYSGNSGGKAGAGTASAAGAAVVHDGYSSVFTVDSANGHLQETFIPKMGDPWQTQDLSAKYGTPPVLNGTKPVTLTHDGYTSVFTVDAGSGHLQETYLPKMGDPWSTQDLTVKYGAPATSWTPTALVHDGYTSVWTVTARDGHLQETYLPKMGDPWSTQDLSAEYGSPQVQAGSSPVAVPHDGYTSVFTISPDHDLHETYLPKMGDPWSTQDLTAKYGTPKSAVTPTAVVHQGYTSVYTVDDGSSHLQETYLPQMGGPWHSQDLSANYGTPWVAPGTQPVAFEHTGYTSVYTVAGGSLHLQETYLPAVGDPWTTQDLSAKYGAPPTDDSPVVLLHPDAAGNVTWSSLFTVDELTMHLQETFLPAIGDDWTSKDLSAQYGTPAVAAAQAPASGWTVVHDGYTSAFTVDAGSDHLQETYLSSMGALWQTQDLSDKYGTPAVMKRTAAATLVHDGYTSVYTIDGSNGHLQETYLTAMGQPWRTQDLSSQFGTPASKVTPAVVYHTGYTSVYTVDAGTGHLWETYLSGIGANWISQDLTARYGTAAVMSGTAPVALLHSGWTSVYTVDSGSGHLRETYLPAIGDPWVTQDLSAKYGTPATGVTPGALVHDGFTSLYTVDSGSNHLRETYLQAIGDDWITQDLTAKYGTPTVAAGVQPVALFHTGYASVYTVDSDSGHVQETFLTAIGANWQSQDLSAKYGTPAANQAPSVLIHPAEDGALTWTSVFSVDSGSNHLQESYLSGIGADWITQDISDKYGTPAV